nr:DUF448 domain-containing protein [Cellulomonas citrea]
MVPPVGPVRTCVGCRARDSRSSLLRVVVAGANAESPRLVLDTAARMPGRGAWVHPDLECLELAERRRAFGRALRSTGPLDTGALRAALTVMTDRATGPVQDGPEPRAEQR